MIKAIKKYCQLGSILLASLETILALEYTWFTAYFNGLNTGNYRVIVYINNFGEAFPELILWIIITPVIIYGSILNLKMIYETYELKNILNIP